MNADKRESERFSKLVVVAFVLFTAAGPNHITISGNALG